MIKLILSPDIKALLTQQENILDRSEVQIFTADTNEEALNIHRAEKARLIVIQLKRFGMSSRRFCSIIREDPELSRVSIVLICANIPSEVEECSQCKANAVLTRPPNTAVLLEMARELLSIASRASYRCLLSVAVDSAIDGASFFCRSVNISSTGMLIEAEHALAKGDSLTCSFFLPTGGRINVLSEVVRDSRPPYGSGANQYGLRFVQLSTEDRQKLEEFIKEQASS